ncbi:MAG: RnfABCDGE type electron transport complex subunit B [Coriobacteriia bacterium]|nr:RnfABCDGE type electron transport complex subunit B [Coriobacteriia bacterium]
MDATLLLKAIGALALMGLVIGAALAVASRAFHVEVDERVARVNTMLPGANCGACGNPSCFQVAVGMVEGTLPPTACTAGGPSVAEAVCETLGLEKATMAAVVSARHCGGGTRAERAFDYSGVLSCNAVQRVGGGDLACAWGCLGYGDCVSACPFDAIHLDERRLPVIDLRKCTGCGLCVKECPRDRFKLLEMIPDDAAVVVRCSAHDKPALRKKTCPVCCIACKKCEKACESDAIHVEDGNAVIDYAKCTACGVCVEVCPQDCIDFTGAGSRLPTSAFDGKAGDAAVKPASRPKEAAEA